MEKINNAYISNISFPKQLTEIRLRLESSGGFVLEDILKENELFLPVPAWSNVGDIVIFMYAKSARAKITKLMTFLYNNQTIEDASSLLDVLLKQLKVHEKYGGKIFAIGQVKTLPVLHKNFYNPYFKNKRVSKIEIIDKLSSPVSLESLCPTFSISKQSTITKMQDETFEKIKKVIMLSNDVSNKFKKASIKNNQE